MHTVTLDLFMNKFRCKKIMEKQTRRSLRVEIEMRKSKYKVRGNENHIMQVS